MKRMVMRSHIGSYETAPSTPAGGYTDGTVKMGEEGVYVGL